MSVQTAEVESMHLSGKGVPAIHVASLCVHNNYFCCSVARTLMFNAKKEGRVRNCPRIQASGGGF